MSRCSGVAAVEFVVNEYDAVRSEQQAGSQTHRRGAEATKVFVGLFGHRKKIAENKHGVFAEIDIPLCRPPSDRDRRADRVAGLAAAVRTRVWRR